MAREIILHVFEPLWREKEKTADAQKKAAAIVMTDGETDVVADNRAAGRDNHYQRNIEFPRRSEIAGDQQNGFARHRHAGILEHHAKENGPVPIDQHVMLDQLQRVVKKIHVRKLYLINTMLQQARRGRVANRETKEKTIHDGRGVSTGSGSDRVAGYGANLDREDHYPVASTTPRGLPARGPRSAPGTDLIFKTRT